MKYQKNDTILRFGLGFLGLCAGVWFASEAMAYREVNQQAEIIAQEQAMTDKLVEVAQLNYMLRQINTGRLEEARALIGSRLECSMAEVSDLKPTVQAPLEAMASGMMTQLAKSQKLHPEYYASLNTHIGAPKAKSGT